ncbi:MAG: metabolism protein [Bacteroidetes bacterium]|nr:metabolism protein [Bacteroidota bacterium]
MQIIYDGTFEGLLTAIFDIYERKFNGVKIFRKDKITALGLFENHEVHSDPDKAARVLRGLKKKLSASTLNNFYWCFLSELDGIEDHILSYARYALSSAQPVEQDYGNASVLEIAQVARKVGREKHRFEAFVRFQEINSNFYYAAIDPDHNVLPLIIPHFRRRYPAQDWLIYDTRRHYGIHYDSQTEQTHEAIMDFDAASNRGQSTCIAIDTDEAHYQSLWKHYFKHVNIPARRNMKLHLQHVPKRYWKYLVEKQ